MKHCTDTSQVLPNSCVAFGRFDGLHIGQRAVIEAVCSQGEGQKVLLSFSEQEAPIIYTEGEKAYLLRDSGLDLMVSLPAKELLPLSAEAFVRDILKGRLQAARVVVGEDARFGADQVDLAAFEALAKQQGIEVIALPALKLDGRMVSADAVKEAISQGDFPRVQRLLGHHYLLQGRVVHGKAAGRKFGMPTANLKVAQNKLFPPHGVYGSNSDIEGKEYRGMTNVGLRPSDDDIPIATVETFLLNFDQDIYGKEVFLELLVYIRGVVKFPGGLAELRLQIDRDIEAVKDYMRKHKQGG